MSGSSFLFLGFFGGSGCFGSLSLPPFLFFEEAFFCAIHWRYVVLIMPSTALMRSISSPIALRSSSVVVDR